MNRALLHELATARFVQQREYALFLGPPGTGKSHLAQALGRAAIQRGCRVVYRETQALIGSFGVRSYGRCSMCAGCARRTLPRHVLR
jgi:DNA replication protein DnaC